MNLTNLLLCLIAVESGGNPDAVKKDCVGVLQERPIFVDQVNKILGRQEFSYEDRKSRLKSLQMARIWFRHFERPDWTLQDYALSFKKGPSAYRVALSEGELSKKDREYVESVKNLMDLMN